jgi:hypothetical protein
MTRKNRITKPHYTSGNDYVVILRWMVTPTPVGLGLRGTPLILFALIYGFSRDNASHYFGGNQYAAHWCGCSTRSIQRALTELIEQNLVIELGGYRQGIRRGKKYAANLEEIERLLDDHPITQETEEADYPEAMILSRDSLSGDEMSRDILSLNHMTNLTLTGDKLSHLYIRDKSIDNKTDKTSSTTENESSGVLDAKIAKIPLSDYDLVMHHV